MKRREFLKLSATMAGAAVTIYMPSAWRPAKAAAKWKVGFSQCTTLEPWRVQFNKDIQAEAKKYPDVDLVITDGQDKTEKQVADCENLSVNDREGPTTVVIGPGKYCLHQTFAVTASHPHTLTCAKASSAEFAPDPALDPLWISYWEPFHGAIKKDFGFQVVLKVAP